VAVIVKNILDDTEKRISVAGLSQTDIQKPSQICAMRLRCSSHISIIAKGSCFHISHKRTQHYFFPLFRHATEGFKVWDVLVCH